jgi:hypothetical protein
MPAPRKYGQPQRDAIYALHVEGLTSEAISERCAAGIDGRPPFEISPRTVRSIVHQERQRRPTSDPRHEDKPKPFGIGNAEHHRRTCTRNDEAFGEWLRWSCEMGAEEAAAGLEPPLFPTEAQIREYHPEWLELMPPSPGRTRAELRKGLGLPADPVETVPNTEPANQHAGETPNGNNGGNESDTVPGYPQARKEPPGGDVQARSTSGSAGGIKDDARAHDGSPPTHKNQAAGLTPEQRELVLEEIKAELGQRRTDNTRPR